MTSVTGRLGPAAADPDKCSCAGELVPRLVAIVGPDDPCDSPDGPDSPNGPDLDPGEAGIAEEEGATMAPERRAEEDEDEDEEEKEADTTPEVTGEAGVDEERLAQATAGEEPLVGRVFETTLECVRRREAAPKSAGRLSVLMECML